MALEIERKFICNLTKDQAKSLAFSSRTVKSIYLKNTTKASIRVVKDTNSHGIVDCKWTVKESTGDLLAREEKEDFLPELIFDILDTLNYPTVNKERFLINVNESIWEVDFFEDYDFVIAELEFKNIKEANNFTDFPIWLGKEVTYDPSYLNCNLAKSRTDNDNEELLVELEKITKNLTDRGHDPDKVLTDFTSMKDCITSVILQSKTWEQLNLSLTCYQPHLDLVLDKQKTLPEQLVEAETTLSSLTQQFKKYLTDESISVKERWDAYKKHSQYLSTGSGCYDVGAVQLISIDSCPDRYRTYDFVDLVESVEDILTDLSDWNVKHNRFLSVTADLDLKYDPNGLVHEWDEKVDAKVNEVKEEVMATGYSAFTYNW